MGYLLDEVKKWKSFIETYGEPREISLDEAKTLEINKVWTLWSRGSDFLANELVESAEVVSHFTTPKSWSGETGSLTFVQTIWIDCPSCDSNSEDEDWDPDECDECEGAGTLSIFIPDCLDAETDEEILERREA